MAIFSSTAFSKLSKSFGNLTTCRMKKAVELCSVYDSVLGMFFSHCIYVFVVSKDGKNASNSQYLALD